mmetsp:Transcript_18951/g.31890  ORF Transcript_18951/g.31890 Transcript_18951/m.31890 type:complete len:625 (-) Transcript_18951:1419-3293(-)
MTNSINQNDDVDAAVQWMLKGRVYASGLQKYLPQTCEDLLSGKVTPEKVADDLDTIYAVKKFSYMGMGGMGWDEDDVRDCGIFVAHAAMPQKFWRAVGISDKGTSINHDFSLTFLSIYTKKAEAFPKIDLKVLVKQATDETCEEWAGRLDKLFFRGKKGAFLKKSPVYHIEPRRFEEHDMPLQKLKRTQANLEMRRDVKRTCILHAAKDVILGVYHIKKTCWQCKQNKDNISLQVCGKCNVASYCSRDCQVEAWKQGHKTACKNLRSKFEEFQKSLKIVDDAHDGKETVVSEGFVLNDGVDYDVLRRTTLRSRVINPAGKTVEIGSRSMEHFYDNLGRVVRGEWWFFPEADEAAYNREIKSGKDDGAVFRSLCDSMTYSSGSQMLTIPITASSMPASRFLEVYHETGGSYGDKDKKRLRRDKRNLAYSAFVKKYHTEKDLVCQINSKLLEAGKTCDHGCFLVNEDFELGSVFTRFVKSRDDHLHACIGTCISLGYDTQKLGATAVNAWTEVTKKMDDENVEFTSLMNDPMERDVLASHFIFLGVEYLLKGKTAHDKMMATAYAFGVLFYSREFYQYDSDGPTEEGNDIGMKLALQGNDLIETIKFFSDRINCSCLKEKLESLGE